MYRATKSAEHGAENIPFKKLLEEFKQANQPFLPKNALRDVVRRLNHIHKTCV
jgi:hypothetical protein